MPKVGMVNRAVVESTSEALRSSGGSTQSDSVYTVALLHDNSGRPAGRMGMADGWMAMKYQCKVAI